jgi:hypothetical protein
LTALGAVFRRDAWGTGRSRHVTGGRASSCIGTQSYDSFQEHPTVTDRTNADFLQILLGEVRKDSLVNLVLTECRLISFEAQAPQPTSDIHGGALLATLPQS